MKNDSLKNNVILILSELCKLQSIQFESIVDCFEDMETYVSEDAEDSIKIKELLEDNPPHH